MAKTDAVVNAGEFRVCCDADRVGRFLVEADSLWVRVGQRILRRGTQELWDSIAVEGKKEPDGSLVVRVLVFNPDWDEPLQIACIPAAGCSTSAATVIAVSGIAAPTAEEKAVACNVKKRIVVMSRVWVPKVVGIIAFANASIASA